MKIIFSSIVILIILTFPSTTIAQTIHLGSKQQYGVKALDPNNKVGNMVANGIQILAIFGGLAVLVFLVWGAFDWITSGGDKEKIASARRKIVNALIGLALLALAAFIVSLFGQIVGFDPLNTPALPKLDAEPAPFQPPAAPGR